MVRSNNATRVLYVIVCAAPPAREVATLVKQAQASGWDVCVIATPSALAFIDTPALEELTGHPLRSHYKQPDESDALPSPDALELAMVDADPLQKARA